MYSESQSSENSLEDFYIEKWGATVVNLPIQMIRFTARYHQTHPFMQKGNKKNQTKYNSVQKIPQCL